MRRVVMPVYETSLHLFVDREEAKAFCMDHSANDEDFSEWCNFDGFSHEITDRDGTVRHILAVFDGKLNTAIHEATHMAQEKMRFLNLPFRKRADETLAYFTAWIAEAMIEYMNEEKPPV